MTNEMIIRDMHNIDLYDLKENEVIALQRNIVDNVNIKKMREVVDYACIDMSKVGPPKFMANARVIAEDNQERLDIICKLLQNFQSFEQDVKIFRKNKFNCNNDYERVFNFLLKTKDLIDTVIEHSDFKIKEREEANRLAEENARRIEEANRLYLNGGDENDS